MKKEEPKPEEGKEVSTLNPSVVMCGISLISNISEK